MPTYRDNRERWIEMMKESIARARAAVLDAARRDRVRRAVLPARARFRPPLSGYAGCHDLGSDRAAGAAPGRPPRGAARARRSRRRRGAARPRRPGRAGRRLRPAAAAPARRACVDRRRRLDRRRQVDARQQSRRLGRQPGRRAPPDDPRARARLQPGGRAGVRRRPRPARARAGERRRRCGRNAPARGDDRASAGAGAARLAGHRLGARGESRSGEPVARRRRRLALRHDRGALRRRRAVGVPPLRARARNGSLDRAEPGAGGRGPGGAGAPAADARGGAARRRRGSRRPRGAARAGAAAGGCALAGAGLARRARGRRTGAGGARAAGRCAARWRACRCGRCVVERAAMEQLAAAAELRAEADHAYADALREVETALRSGSLLRGEVLARWHEVVGTGDVMRALETRVGWLRDRLKSIVTGAPAAERSSRWRSSIGSRRSCARPPSEPPSGRRGRGGSACPAARCSGGTCARAGDSASSRRRPRTRYARGRASSSTSSARKVPRSGRRRALRRSASTAPG